MFRRSDSSGNWKLPRVHRRWRTNLALLAVVAALTVFTLYSPRPEEIDAKPALATLATEAIDRIRLARPGQPDIVLEKNADHWRLTAPVAARANRFNVDNLLRVPATRSELKLEDSDPGRYGLLAPQARLEIGDVHFEFGSLHPFRPQVYVRHRGGVHLVSAQILGTVLRGENHFIDARLLEAGSRLIGLRLPGFTLDLNDGRWLRQPPLPDLASDRLGDFVARWTNAQALSVEPGNSARPALASVRLVRVRDTGKPETLALDILAYKPTFVLRRRDEKLDYHFPEEIGKRLLEIGNDG